MRKNVNIGRSLGHIEVPEGILVQPRELEDWPDEKLVIISTGSQGEPLSALRRMAHRDHPQVELHEGDTVLFSATPIPGNERAVNETIDRLYHIGCDVITTREAPIHASGHGYQEELKLMLNLTRPRYVMPFHGDHKRIHLHGRLAEAVGIDADNVFKGENGLPLELDGSGARFAKPERSGMIFVDGVDIGDPTDVALRDRRMLSADGIFVVVATISEQDGSSVAEPEVIFRGVPYPDDADRDARRDPRHRRGLAGARRAARRSARSTCSSRSCTTTSPSSSTSACAGARWCCRSSSRSSRSPRRRLAVALLDGEAAADARPARRARARSSTRPTRAARSGCGARTRSGSPRTTRAPSSRPASWPPRARTGTSSAA